AQRPRWHTDRCSGSDTICNSPDLLLARYCPLCGFHAPPHGFAFEKSPLVKMRLTRERYPHSYKECFCNSPDLPLARYFSLCGIHAPPHGFAFDETQAYQNPSY
ncbi:hypothetical protein PIB30_088343, partial [Stylosanthes scabra]|nr:hypothetical protein [Stylosanthes scabra]